MLRIVIYFWNRELPEYLWCAQQFAQLLYYTNFSINFLLYAMCGKSFRLCLRKMFVRIFDPCIVGLHKLRGIF